MADGKIVIETDIDNTGVEKGLKKTERTAKSQAAKLAAEYRKQGLSASDAFKQAWSEIERTSKTSSDNVASHWNQSSESVASGASKIGNIAKTGCTAALSAITAVSGALTAAGGYAIKTGIDFESSFAGVKKTVSATDEQLEELRSGILDMSKEIPQSASSLAEIGEAAGQLGIKTENIEGFIEVMANLGVATNMSSDQAATSLARLANITGMPQTQFDRLGSTIVALGNNLATTESEITEMGLRLAGAGTQVGMSEAQIMSFAAALSSVGIEAEAGGSAFSKVMVDMQLATEKGGESLDNFANVAGMSADEFKQAFEKDAAGAMLAFIKGLSTCDERGISAIKTLDDMGISEVRMRDALLRAAGASDVFSQALEIGSQAWEENTALTKEAEQRYETLESRIQLAKNSVDILAIAFKDSIDSELRSAVDKAIDYVDELTEAFEEGGLKSAVEKAGEIFGDLATEASKQAPKMVKSAVTFIQSFVKGIISNKQEIWSAAVEISKALGDGLADMLPKSVQKPVKDAIDKMAKSLTSGGIKNAIGTTVTMFENLATTAGKIFVPAIELAVDILDILGEHAEIVVPLVAAGATAFGAYKIAGSITPLITAFDTALVMLTSAEEANTLQTMISTGALSAKEVIVGVITGKITLATAATTAWNAALSVLGGPLGLALTAVGVLTAGIIAYCATQEEAALETTAWVEENEALMESLSKTNESVQRSIEQRQQSYDGAMSEAGAIDILTQKLFELSDKENKSAEDKAAMAAIVDELNGNIPGLNLVIDEETGYLNMNKDAIVAVTEASKDMIMAKAAQESLVPIAQSIWEAEMNLAEAEQARNDAMEVLNEKQSAYNTVVAQYEKELLNSGSATSETEEALNKCRGEMEAAQSVVSELDTTIDECNQTLDDANAKYDFMQGKVAEYSATTNQAKVSIDEMGASEQLLAAVHSESADQIQQALTTVSEGMLTATNANREQLTQQVSDLENNAAMMLAALQAGMPGVTQEMVDQCNQMVFAAKGELDQLAPTFQGAADTAGQAAVTTTAGHTPSYNAANKDFAENGKQGFDSADVPGHHGKAAGDAANAAIQETTAHWREEYAAGAGTGRNLNEGLDSQGVEGHFGSTGGAAGSNLASSMNAQTGAANAAGSSIGDGANSGVDASEVDSHFSVIANLAVYEFIRAMAALKDLSRSTGQEIGDNSVNGLRIGSDGTYGLGIDFANGYANGIYGGLSAAVAAAASMAAQAIAAVQATQASASPSKKTRKLAHDFDDGYIGGILDKEDEVEAAAEQISKTALGALDFTGIDASGLVKRMRDTVAAENHAIGESLSSEFVNKIYKNVELENNQELINYEKMASYIVAALIRAGVKVEVDGRDFGRLIGEIVGV